MAFGTAKSVLFIEVSSFQGVLIRGIPLQIISHTGEPQHAIECLRRTLRYCPNDAKDVGYIGLANVFHRNGFMNDAIIAARAGLDVVENSVSL